MLVDSSLVKMSDCWKSHGKNISGPNIKGQHVVRPPDTEAVILNLFSYFQPKHMLWVLKRTVSLRRFF